MTLVAMLPKGAVELDFQIDTWREADPPETFIHLQSAASHRSTTHPYVLITSSSIRRFDPDSSFSPPRQVRPRRSSNKHREERVVWFTALVVLNPTVRSDVPIPTPKGSPTSPLPSSPRNNASSSSKVRPSSTALMSAGSLTSTHPTALLNVTTTPIANLPLPLPFPTTLSHPSPSLPHKTPRATTLVPPILPSR